MNRKKTNAKNRKKREGRQSYTFRFATVENHSVLKTMYDWLVLNVETGLWDGSKTVEGNNLHRIIGMYGEKEKRRDFFLIGWMNTGISINMIIEILRIILQVHGGENVCSKEGHEVGQVVFSEQYIFGIYTAKEHGQRITMVLMSDRNAYVQELMDTVGIAGLFHRILQANGRIGRQKGMSCTLTKNEIDAINWRNNSPFDRVFNY